MNKVFEVLGADDEDSCCICLEKYSKENIPMILKCSHTICKKCINSFLKNENPKCPNCNMVIEKNRNENDILWENKIILNLLDLCNFLNIDVNSFLSFPLNFKYCETCHFYISNYSFASHKSLKHKLISFNKQLKLFFENNFNKKISNISLDTNKYIIILLYYYKSAFLPNYKYFEVKKSIIIGNSQFKFYGQIANDNILSSNLTRSELEGKCHKGVLINKEKGLLIHGYFFIKIQNKKYLISKILGLLSYKEIIFYGFIKINNNNKEDIIIEDFILECGLLYDKKYYFGVFNEAYMKTYLLNRNDNNNSNKKILIKGEIISLKDDGVEVEEINVNSSPEVPKIPQNSVVMPKPKIKVRVKNSNIEIYNSKEFISIEPLSKGVDENNFKYFHLNECNIYLSKYDENQFNFLIQIKENNSMNIINYFKGTLINSINYQEGYLIYFNQNISESLNSLYCLTLKDIIDNADNFVENLNKLLKTEIKYCKMEYCFFKRNNNSLDKIDENYFEINPYFIKEIKKNKSTISEKIYRENDVLNTAKIEDILNGLLKDIVKFDEKEFNEDKSKNEGCLTI